MDCFAKKVMWLALIVGCVSMLMPTPVRAADAKAYVWIEGEAAAKANFKFEVRKPYEKIKPNYGSKYVASGDAYMACEFGKAAKGNRAQDVEEASKATLRKLPAGGLALTYEFKAAHGGKYDVWFNLGHEVDRAPMSWRLDGGAWHEVSPMQVGTSLLSKSWWTDVFSWVKSDVVDLKAGDHKLEMRWTTPGRTGNIQLGVDAIAFVQGFWQPDGVLKPGQQYDDDIDREARKHVFRVGLQPDAEAGRRQNFELNGVWEIARYDDPDMDVDTYKPILAIPAEKEYPLQWRGVHVPMDIGLMNVKASMRPPKQYRAEMRFAYRMFYRTRMHIPADMKGRSFRLRFAHVNWLVSVFVNGKLCGSETTEMVPWEVDVTDAVKPGEVNTIMVGIKTVTYAREPRSLKRGKDSPKYMHLTRHIRRGNRLTPNSGWGFPSCQNVGLAYPVELRVGGEVYATDVHVQTSVKAMRLDTDVTLHNPTSNPVQVTVHCEAVHDKSGAVEKTLPEKIVTVPAGGDTGVHADAIWMDPKLWWPTEGPDDKPDCYRMRTTILADGNPIEVREDLFGFKEITYEGRQLLLNNVPQHFWNYQFFGNKWDADGFLDAYYRYNIRGIRVNGFVGIAGKAKPMDSLAWLARNGIPTRQCLNAEGMMFGNEVNHPLFWENMARHTKQALRVLRNHPNIMMYSLGNELFLINGMMAHPTYEIMERRGAAVAEIVRQMDPQRRGLYDGGGDLGGLLDMCCQHYTLPRGRRYPWRCYDHIKSAQPIRPRRKHQWKFHNYNSREDMFFWNGRVPWILGEVGFYANKREKAIWLAGPETYESALTADDAYGYYTRICAEGLRWQGNTEICLWSGAVSQSMGAHHAWPYKAAFLREHDCVHYPESTLRRTVRVFNDTHLPAGLELTAEAVFDDEGAAEWKQLFVVPAGRWMRGEIVIELPPAMKRREGKLVLTLTEGRTTVFSDSKDLVLQPVPGAVEEADASNLTVWDPQGKVSAWLTGRGQGYRLAKTLGEVGGAVTVLLVGPYALPSPEDPDRAGCVRKLNALADAGARVILLEQAYPLEGNELPVEGIKVAQVKGSFALYQEFAGAVDANGAIAFPVVPAHPIFRDIETKDFYTWADAAKDWRDRRDWVFINSYQNPKVGVPLVQAMGKLAVTAMLQLDSGKGTLLLSQLLIGTKLGLEPTADKLLMNTLRWAATAGRKVVRPTSVVCSDAYDAFLGKTSLQYWRAASLEDAFGKAGGIVVVEGKPDNLRWLVKHAKQVRKHCDEGGWVMVSSLTPDALADFNKLVGVEHRIRPFRLDKALLRNKRDPLLFGLTSAGLEQYQNKVLASWAGKWYRSATVFSHVVNYDDIAPFASIEDEKQFKLVNGLTNDDFWLYITYMRTPDSGTFEKMEDYPLQWEFKFAEPEGVEALEFVLNGSYHFIKELGIIVDGKEAGMKTIMLENTSRQQRVDLGKPQKAKSVTLRVLSTYPGKKTFCGIDNVRMFQPLSKAMKEKVVPLSDPAGLVKYPIGKGGIVLNQLDYRRDDRNQPDAKGKMPREPNENLEKKLNFTLSLLLNMGADVK